MRSATRSDKKLVIDILSCQFSNVPGTTWMLRRGAFLKYHIRTLAALAFEKAIVRKGVYISSNQQGIALCYKSNQKVFSLRELAMKLWFAFSAVRWSKFMRMIKLEKYKEQQRPRSGNYFHFWFFAVLKGGKNAGFELKNEIFQMASEQHLPIYAETSMHLNKRVYERYGFETYHFWENKMDQLQLWFMRYKPCV